MPIQGVADSSGAYQYDPEEYEDLEIYQADLDGIWRKGAAHRPASDDQFFESLLESDQEEDDRIEGSGQ